MPATVRGIIAVFSNLQMLVTDCCFITKKHDSKNSFLLLYNGPVNCR
jgi:hypothetical protein